MVNSTEQSDELNWIRLFFIDQQERKLSRHLHGHSVHQEINGKDIVHRAQ